MSQVVAGLGNPGVKYAETRHNIGFMVVELIARKAEANWSSIPNSKVAYASLGGKRLLLVKPETYMNRSGTALREIIAEGRFSLSQLIVVHDDLDLPFGALKIRTGGGHGGHNGIRSLIEELGGGDFVRIKCGISRPPEGVETADHVLGPFSEDEAATLSEFVERAANAVEVILEHGTTEAMQRFHKKPEKPTQPKAEAPKEN